MTKTQKDQIKKQVNEYLDMALIITNDFPNERYGDYIQVAKMIQKEHLANKKCECGKGEICQEK